MSNSGNIEFRNVSFDYGQGKVLDDVSFVSEKGKKTAIVGLSGSGKSTILNLIEKFYDPDSGEISMAGNDVKDLQQLDFAFTETANNAKAD